MKNIQGSLISYFSTLVKQNGGINLAQGIPGFAPPEELLDKLKNIAAENIHQYPPGIGNFKLRESLLKFYSSEKVLSSDNILIVQGATEALCLVFLFIMGNTGGNFATLSFTPPYESYRQLPKQFNLPFFEVEPTENGEIPISLVEEHINKNNVRLIFLASPGNPHGIIFSQENINELIDLCAQKKCYLVFDSVYSMLYYSNQPYVPLSRLNPYLFIVDSFSKWFSITGWRVGMLLHDETHCNAIRSMHDYTGLCTNSVLQEALLQYIENHDFGKDYSENLRQVLFENYLKASEKLNEAGFICKKSEGGYFIWVELPPKFSDGLDFALNLFESHKIATVPGIHFSDKAKNIIRINIARPINELTTGIDGIIDFIGKKMKVKI